MFVDENMGNHSGDDGTYNIFVRNFYKGPRTKLSEKKSKGSLLYAGRVYFRL